MQTTKAQLSLRSLISTFVVPCLESIIPSFYIRNFKRLTGFFGCTGQLESTLVTNPKDRFSRDMAHLSQPMWEGCLSQRQTAKVQMSLCIWLSVLTCQILCCWHTIPNLNEPPHDKTNKMTCAPSEDPSRLIRVFAVRMKIPWVPSYP